MRPISIDGARAAKAKAKELLAEHAAVNGIGLTEDEGGYAIKVNLVRAPAANEQIPDRIDGAPVVTEVVGTIRKLPA